MYRHDLPFTLLRNLRSLFFRTEKFTLVCNVGSNRSRISDQIQSGQCGIQNYPVYPSSVCISLRGLYRSPSQFLVEKGGGFDPTNYPFWIHLLLNFSFLFVCLLGGESPSGTLMSGNISRIETDLICFICKIDFRQKWVQTLT